jgi:hypothetical protein
MTEQRSNAPDEDEKANIDEEPPPDESTMMGVSGVEAEVLAEARRAEAQLADPDAEPGDDRGAET